MPTSSERNIGVDATIAQAKQPRGAPKGSRYYAIIIALCVVSSLPALEGTVVSTALPSIVHELGGGQMYVWVVNAYFLSW
jgi:hypothetical protein